MQYGNIRIILYFSVNNVAGTILQKSLNLTIIMEISLEQHLRDYAASFLNGQPENDQNIRLKLAHSFRVRNEAKSIAEAELTDNTLRTIAEQTALLHDLSRFEQFARFGTFNDLLSFDHGDRAAELVAEQHLLDDLTEVDRNDAIAAIRCHNKLTIPDTLSVQGVILAKIVRDADKIDIMPILFDYLKHPTNKSVVHNLAISNELSPAIWEDLSKRRLPPNSKISSTIDFIASKLNWVYDLNYPTSRQIFRDRGYLETLREFLPNTPQVNTIYYAASSWLTNIDKKE